MSKPPAPHTRRAYAADWADYGRWCRKHGHTALPPAPVTVAAYLHQLGKTHSPATVARRLAGLIWNASQRGFTISRDDPVISPKLSPPQPRQPAPSLRPADIAAMAATLPFDLRGLRDRAILLVGFTARLRRSQIVGLDLSPGANSFDPATGQLTIADHRTPLPRASDPLLCPVQATTRWLHYARHNAGPLFTATSRDGTRILPRRLNDKHIARLITRTAQDAGLPPGITAQSLRNR